MRSKSGKGRFSSVPAVTPSLSLSNKAVASCDCRACANNANGSSYFLSARSSEDDDDDDLLDALLRSFFRLDCFLAEEGEERCFLFFLDAAKAAGTSVRPIVPRSAVAPPRI